MVTMQKASPGATQSAAATSSATETAGTGTNAGPGIMVSLNSGRGSYDAAWLEAMTDIHMDIIQGGMRVLRFNINPQLRAFVQRSSATATAEIRQMQGLLAKVGDK